MKAVRKYSFERHSTDRTFVCDVFLPEVYVNDPDPAISIHFEMGVPKSGALTPLRLKAGARIDCPSQLVIEEITRLFQTLKQMYEL